MVAEVCVSTLCRYRSRVGHDTLCAVLCVMQPWLCWISLSCEDKTTYKPRTYLKGICIFYHVLPCRCSGIYLFTLSLCVYISSMGQPWWLSQNGHVHVRAEGGLVKCQIDMKTVTLKLFASSAVLRYPVFALIGICIVYPRDGGYGA
jgi:hypothetical protein